MTSKTVLVMITAAAMSACSLAQVAQRPASTPPPPRNSRAASLTPGGVGDIQSLLAALQQNAQQTSRDLSSMRIEKWKTDGATKGQTQSNAEAVQRNLNDALPSIISEVRAAPDDVARTFKLYRNLGALYDVLSSVVESAGAFGSKSEFQTLANDLSAMDKSRHTLGDRVETLATIKEAEIARLRTQLKTAQTNEAPAQPKKVIVDDEAPKKPIKKKKKTTTSTTTTESKQPQ
jgi:hypothetical protein